MRLSAPSPGAHNAAVTRAQHFTPNTPRSSATCSDSTASPCPCPCPGCGTGCETGCVAGGRRCRPSTVDSGRRCDCGSDCGSACGSAQVGCGSAAAGCGSAPAPAPCSRHPAPLPAAGPPPALPPRSPSALAAPPPLAAASAAPRVDGHMAAPELSGPCNAQPKLQHQQRSLPPSSRQPPTDVPSKLATTTPCTLTHLRCSQAILLYLFVQLRSHEALEPLLRGLLALVNGLDYSSGGGCCSSLGSAVVLWAAGGCRAGRGRTCCVSGASQAV